MPNTVRDQLTYLIKNSLVDIAFYFIAIVLAGWVLYTLNLRMVSQKLATESHHDPLTGLLNRRGFMVALKSVERHQYYSFMIIDLDNFKHVNDTYGHPVGDAVIKKIAELSYDVFRSEDTIGRIGGEEFLCILPRTDVKQCQAIAERFLNKVSSQIFLSTPSLRVTVSIGIASFSKLSPSCEALYLHADKALYQAKYNGKNNVVIYHE